MFDNSAYTQWKQGKQLPGSNKDFAAFVKPWLVHPHWAVIPDVIEGSVVDNDAAIAAWEHPRPLSCPVWHMHESLRRLIDLAVHWPRIAIGSSGDYTEPGTTAWTLRIDAAWEALRQANLYPHVHMMRAMLQASDGRWPFGSADSASAARNHGAIPSRGLPAKDVVELVNHKNSRNPSPWRLGSQRQLFDAQP